MLLARTYRYNRKQHFGIPHDNFETVSPEFELRRICGILCGYFKNILTSRHFLCRLHDRSKTQRSRGCRATGSMVAYAGQPYHIIGKKSYSLKDDVKTLRSDNRGYYLRQVYEPDDVLNVAPACFPDSDSNHSHIRREFQKNCRYYEVQGSSS